MGIFEAIITLIIATPVSIGALIVYRGLRGVL